MTRWNNGIGFELGYKSGKAEAMRWIPCSERLPEYTEMVLACLDMRVAMDARYQIIIDSYFQEEWWKDGTVVAWMPLPEPYKEVDNETMA